MNSQPIFIQVLRAFSIVQACEPIIIEYYDMFSSLQKIYGQQLHEWLQRRATIHGNIRHIVAKIETNWERTVHDHPLRHYPYVNRQNIIRILGNLYAIQVRGHHHAPPLDIQQVHHWRIEEAIASAEQAVRDMSWEFCYIEYHFETALTTLNQVEATRTFHADLMQHLIGQLDVMEAQLLPPAIQNWQPFLW
jgi:hypothetical protein